MEAKHVGRAPLVASSTGTAPSTVHRNQTIGTLIPAALCSHTSRGAVVDAICSAEPSGGKKLAKVGIQEGGSTASSWETVGRVRNVGANGRGQVTGVRQDAVGRAAHESTVITGMPGTFLLLVTSGDTVGSSY